MRILLRLAWGFVVLGALLTAIATISAVAAGRFTDGLLLTGVLVALALITSGIDRVAKRKRVTSVHRQGGIDSFRWAAQRIAPVAVAGLITATIGIAASQVKLIIDHGVTGWLTDDANTLGELIAVTVLLLVVTAVIVWPVWVLGRYAAGRSMSTA